MDIPRKKNTDQVNLLTPKESITSEMVKLFTFSFSLEALPGNQASPIIVVTNL